MTAATASPDRRLGAAVGRWPHLHGVPIGQAIVPHLPIASLVAAGLVLRLLVYLAFRPALEYADSPEYLLIAANLLPIGHRPAGYSVFLRVLSYTGHFGSVTLAQHLLGLLVGVLLYLLLLRAGARPWLSALGAAPILLDAYQVDIEQYVLAETLADTLVGLAAAVLLWSDRPSPWHAAAGGLLLALAGLTRTALLPLVVPALAFVLLRRVELRNLASAACLAGAFALPLAGYASWNKQYTGQFALSDFQGVFLYGRVAPIADCSRLTLTAAERRLCPAGSPGQRPPPAFYIWDPRSPFFQPWPGADPVKKEQVAQSFAIKVVRQQPGTYARMVLADAVRSFQPNRDPASNRVWLFPQDARSPILANLMFVHEVGRQLVPDRRDPHLASASLAAWLAAYQRVAFTPGPALGLFLLAGLAAGAGLALPSAADRRLRSTALVLTLFGATVLVVPPATALFDYRYLLPALVVLPPSAAAAVEVLFRRLLPARTPDSVEVVGDLHQQVSREQEG